MRPFDGILGILGEFFELFWRKRDTLFKVRLCTFAFRNRKACKRLFSLFFCASEIVNRLAVLVNPLFGIEKVAKDFRRSNAAAKARLRGGFRPKLTISIPRKSYKSDRLLLRCAHVSNDEIARRCSALLDEGFLSNFWLLGTKCYFYKI